MTAGIVLAVSACATAAPAPSLTSIASAPWTASAGPTVDPAPTTAASASAAADVLPRRVAGTPLGAADNPGYTVEIAAAGWTSDGTFTVKKPGPVMGFSVWDVGQVPTDPCHPLTTMRDPGPTLDDLVTALVAQKSRDTSKPKAVTLDGFAGKYLEWSVPRDAKVVGDSDFVGCDAQDNGHLDFVSWLADGHGERYQQEAGQVDQLWILDVDGHRLLADATYSLKSTDAARRELAAVAASLEFNDN
jgi:hypothetical protein